MMFDFQGFMAVFLFYFINIIYTLGILSMIHRLPSTTLKTFSSSCTSLYRCLTLNNSYQAHDWSHIYDGIYKFEDNTLG